MHLAVWEHLALLCVFFVGESKPLAISRDLQFGRLHFDGIDCSCPRALTALGNIFVPLIPRR
jgi:hypothetical protein